MPKINKYENIDNVEREAKKDLIDRHSPFITVEGEAKKGETLKKYLNHIRILEAKRLLKNSDRQISEIAYIVGYGNISHFNRTFKQIEKYHPKNLETILISNKII